LQILSFLILRDKIIKILAHSRNYTAFFLNFSYRLLQILAREFTLQIKYVQNTQILLNKEVENIFTRSFLQKYQSYY